MEKKVVSIVAILLLLGLFTSAVKIHPVVAGTIIVPDNYATIQEAIQAASAGDTVYVRNGTYYENVIVDKPVSLVGESTEKTIIDGGFIMSTVSITANDVLVTGFTVANSGGVYPESGILLDGVENSIITNNNVSGNEGHGIFVIWGRNNTVRSNIIVHNNQPGVRVDGHDTPAKIENNTIEYNEHGIFLYDAQDILVDSNTVSNNAEFGITPQGDCRNVTIAHNSITHNEWDGIFIIYSSGIVVSENEITLNSGNGVSIDQSSNNTLSTNKIEDNNQAGILVGSASHNNTLIRNKITASIRDGVRIFSSNYSNVSKNDVMGNGESGIFVTQSSNCSLWENHVAHNGDGITLVSSNSTRISGNKIANNWNGIVMDHSFGNKLHHNNYEENILQVSVVGSGYPNMWNDTYPSAGNYWSNYLGSDANGDGIGDTPYFVNTDNIDNYPLIMPYITGDIDHDSAVDVFDLCSMGKTYGLALGSPNWNDSADISDDNIVNIADLLLLNENYGKKNP